MTGKQASPYNKRLMRHTGIFTEYNKDIASFVSGVPRKNTVSYNVEIHTAGRDT